MLEINLTPNRPDCTGVHGIARDLSAADMGKFRDPAIKPIKGEFPCPVKVTVEDATLSPASRCGWCAGSRTARRRNGCSGA